jgi:hypothetical protein
MGRSGFQGKLLFEGTGKLANFQGTGKLANFQEIRSHEGKHGLDSLSGKWKFASCGSACMDGRTGDKKSGSR